MLVGASQDAFDHSMCWRPSFAFPERSATGRVDVPSRISIQDAMGERETGTLIGSDKVDRRLRPRRVENRQRRARDD